ncbi:MAG: hypothetical protein GY862_38590 [Gammaproteobacteria bacterium]|nr:hypothetical protein [Gammaproteobacteria bacterium]
MFSSRYKIESLRQTIYSLDTSVFVIRYEAFHLKDDSVHDYTALGRYPENDLKQRVITM